MAFTSSITYGLQQQGLDMVKAYEDTQLVIKTLQYTRTKVEEFHHDCFEFCSGLANKLNVNITKPRTCQRQKFRQNATTSNEQSTTEQVVENYYRINVTVPLLDDLVQRMIERFDSGQNIVIKGTMLIPAYFITNSSWKSSIAPFTSFYAEDLPLQLTLSAELEIWHQKWNLFWEEEFKNST